MNIININTNIIISCLGVLVCVIGFILVLMQIYFPTDKIEFNNKIYSCVKEPSKGFLTVGIILFAIGLTIVCASGILLTYNGNIELMIRTIVEKLLI